MIIQQNNSTERAPSNNPDNPQPPTPPPPGPPDPPQPEPTPFVLSPLSAAQADHLIRLSREVAAERGLSTDYDGEGGLLIAGTTQVAGLTNLARIVAPHRQHRWPQLVTAHFDQLANSLQHGPPPAPEDPERDLYLRLVPTSALPPAWTVTAPEFVPGLLAVPATYDNGVVAMHLDPSDFSMTWPEAERAGLANLRKLPDSIAYAEHQGVRVAMLSGSAFTASRALVLDTVLRDSLQIENPPFGVLAAMPVRDLLLVHVIADLSVIPALGMMVNLATRFHSEQPGPLSPWVYLVSPAGWQPAIECSDDHHLKLSPHLLNLARTLERLE